MSSTTKRAGIERRQLDEVVQPVPRRVAVGLPSIPEEVRFSFAHSDSDLYESVRTSLEAV